MKLQQSKFSGSKRLNVGLSACILGLVLCPLAYIAIGALAGFSLEFSFLALPLLLMSVSYLLYRFLLRPGRASSSKLFMALEIVSWVVIAAFIVVVSDFTLLTQFERIGLFCTLFLVSALVSLPIVLLRSTVLGERLRWLPSIVIILLLFVVLLVAVVTTTFYILRVPEFL